MQNSLKLFALTTLAAAVLSACGGSSNDDDDVIPTPVPVTIGDMAGLTTGGKIITFNRLAPATLVSDLAISGLGSGEQLIGIDVRPATGELYSVSTTGRIYTIDPATGVATFKVALTSDAASPTAFAALSGTSFGLDFNPVPDRLRIVSNTGQNLRINVETGATLVDGAINGATAAITASAYTNSFAGATTTRLFNIDCSTGQRYLQNPPNNGVLTDATPLGVTCTSAAGFDIDSRNNAGYAALTSGSATSLYTVSLATGGAATLVGTIGTGQALSGLALLSQPAKPTVFVLGAVNTLARIDPAAPNTLTGGVTISGLNAGETVLGIDFRPVGGQLYALTSAARLVTVNPDTGAAVPVATLSADATDSTAPFTILQGSTFAVDFNPAADRLRVISDLGQSLRINVATGATTTDGDINRASPATVVGAAYANSFAGTATTTLYDLDAATDVLARQDPPNAGTLVDIGPLGVDLTGQNAFDIAGGDNGLALAALRTGAAGPYSLYNINLATGQATLRGAAAAAVIGGTAGLTVTDIAIRY